MSNDNYSTEITTTPLKLPPLNNRNHRYTVDSTKERFRAQQVLLILASVGIAFTALIFKWHVLSANVTIKFLSSDRNRTLLFHTIARHKWRWRCNWWRNKCCRSKWLSLITSSSITSCHGNRRWRNIWWRDECLLPSAWYVILLRQAW